MKKVIILLILMIIVPMKIDASCNSKELADLRKLANNVNLSYEYNPNEPEYFRVVINNIHPKIYVIDKITGEKYYYENSTNGQVTTNRFSGINKMEYVVYSNVSGCYNELSRKSIELPIYNIYYEYDICNGIEDFYLCNKWNPYEGTYEEFVSEVNLYKNSLNSGIVEDSNMSVNNNESNLLLDIYIEYYYIVLPIIIIVGVIVIYIYNKRTKFNLGGF